MGKLVEPDMGLIIWTIVTFLCLVFILAKAAWGPLIAAIEEREHKMKSDLDGAKAARDEAEKIKQQLEAEISGLQAKSRELLAQAGKDGEALRAKLQASAEADAKKIKEKTLAELEDEKQRLVRDLRKEVSTMSVMVAEKLLKKTVDDGVQKNVLDSFFKELDNKRAN
jgi:F-type H+-transporting ATPase subunit b